MRYVVWAIKLLIFAVVVLFAYKNMAPVDVQLFGSAKVLSVPLVVVMLVAFVTGTLLGVLLMLPSTWRRRREAGRLRRDLAKVGKVVNAPNPSSGKPEPAAGAQDRIGAAGSVKPL